jgi:transglutaminase-like putative cysteine protease
LSYARHPDSVLSYKRSTCGPMAGGARACANPLLHTTWIQGLFMPATALLARPPLPTLSSTLNIDCMLAYELDGDCEFLFMIHPADHPLQTLVEEELRLEPRVPHRILVDAHSGNRVLRLRAGAGTLRLDYRAQVLRRADEDSSDAPELPVSELPDEVLRYLLPTRYCESDLLGAVARQTFGALAPGHQRVREICRWVHQNIEYRIGSTDATTTARDVFLQRAGVCRDFAHLSIALCRALNIPARLVSGYARFDEPPPDFHAVFEAYLGGRWVLFDPTQMVPVDQLVRVAHGLDAKDIAFATIYGPARMTGMSPEVETVVATSTPGSR